jgi:hypothetical protein
MLPDGNSECLSKYFPTLPAIFFAFDVESGMSRARENKFGPVELVVCLARFLQQVFWRPV